MRTERRKKEGELKMQFRLRIYLGNAEMESLDHIATALEETAKKLKSGRDEGIIKDINGNKVGEFFIHGAE
jgi:hypothetical protein